MAPGTIINSLTGVGIDVSDIPVENNVKRGGTQQPESSEAKAQEQREATTLMVFHTSPADVPPSPKEPPSPDSDETIPEVLSFGQPPDNVLVSDLLV